MQKIKVLHILHSFGIGGMEKGIAMLINNASAEFEHMILCLTCTGDSRHLISADIPIYEMHKPAGNSLGFIVKLAKKIREIKPDVVHTRNWGGMDGIIAARLSGCKVVVHGEHGWGMDDPQGSSLKRKFLRRWLSLWVTEFTAVSQQIKVWLEEDVRVFKPVAQIYNGVESSGPQRGRSAREIRQELNIPEAAFLIGTVGRLDPIKDQAGLIEAFAKLKALRPDSYLLIVGDGPEREKLEQLKIDGIYLLGMRKDVADILAALNLFVLSSLNEGISNTILEAMAAGLPIVATAVGGTPELIVNDKNGLLVAPGDYGNLADAMSRYTEDPVLCDQHGCENQSIIDAKFSVLAMVKGYETVWRRTVDI
jgi:sugar transferase (PEP-CTERM/EpsH1 system associated)